MLKPFAKVAFTDSVKKFQEVYHSRAAYQKMENSGRGLQLGSQEIEFIGLRDGFYQASVSETQWPYVQFRGGPPGFLKVLGPELLGYADLPGNRQFISLGNLSQNDKICLFLMDYAHRRRLKIFGRVRFSQNLDDLQLFGQPQGERAVLIQVEAFDWNCPSHITPRYSQEEWLQLNREFP